MSKAISQGIFSLFLAFFACMLTFGYSEENLFRKIERGYHLLNSRMIISNHTDVSHLACGLFCLRKKNCVGFNYKPGGEANAVINCQLTNCPAVKKRDGGDQHSDDSDWAFYQAVQIFLYGSKENPGSSCQDILKKTCSRTDARDGIYWITLKKTDQQSFPVFCDMKNGGWTMVFKSIAGESEPIIGKWNSFQSINEYSLEALSKDNTFKHHYKNRIVQDWKTFNPKKARVVLYTKGKQQLVLKFNVSGSDNLNWFKEDRLRQSPWQDIFTTSKNFFSVTGSCSHTGHCRGFFINHGYGGCPNDAGWLMIGGLEACQWETRFPGNSFQYSKLANYVVWRTPENVGTAEVFAVYLR